MNVAFFIRHFTSGGTENSAFNYAHYNETILGNKSYIICFTEAVQQKFSYFADRVSYPMFASRFPTIEINDISEMKDIISKYKLNFFYTQTHGGQDFYQFDNKDLWNGCKTIKHCVFDTTHPEGDYYMSISGCLNDRFNTMVPVTPYIVTLPECNENFRKHLGIPLDATVIGRHGGSNQFNISFVHDCIKEYLEISSNTYFLFMNTDKFYEHPRIIYLDRTIDNYTKARFINTCDAMIHARQIGETFGLAVAEFSCSNKPVITCRIGDVEHINILKDKALIYTNEEELLGIFSNIQDIIRRKDNWNAYMEFSPKNIMKKFNDMIFRR